MNESTRLSPDEKDALLAAAFPPIPRPPHPFQSVELIGGRFDGRILSTTEAQFFAFRDHKGEPIIIVPLENDNDDWHGYRFREDGRAVYDREIAD